MLFAYVVCLPKVAKQCVISWLCYTNGMIVTFWTCSTADNWFTYF